MEMKSRTTHVPKQGEIARRKSTRFIPERLGTPEDVYDDPEPRSSQSTPTTTNTTGELKFDIPSNPSPKYLFNLATRLQSRHTFLQSSLKQATITAQEAAASVFIMQARLDSERKKMRRMMETVADLVGNWKEQGSENGDDDDGEQGDEAEEDDTGEGEMGPDHPNVAPPGEKSSASPPDLISDGLNLGKGKEKETNTMQALPVVHERPSMVQFHSSPGRGSGFTIAFGSKSKTTPNFSHALDLSRKRSRAEHDEEVGEGSNSTGQRFTSVQGRNVGSSQKRPRLEHQISNENQFIQGSSTGPGISQRSDADALYDAYQNSRTTNSTTKPRSGMPLKRTYSVHNFDDCGEDPWSAENGSITQVSACSSPPPSSPPPIPFPKSYTLPNMFDFLWGPNSAKASAKARELVGMPTRNSVVKRNLRAPLAGRAQVPTQALRRAPNQRRNGSGAVQNTLRRTPSTVNATEDLNPGQKETMVGRSMAAGPPALSQLPNRTRPREEEDGEEEAQERPSKRSRSSV